MVAAMTALLSLSSATSALAQMQRPEDGWYVRLGTFGFVAPEFEGSDHYKVRPLPDIEITYDNRFFLSRQGLGANLVTSDDLTIGAAVAFDGGRRSTTDKSLFGYRSVGDTAIGHIFAEYSIDRLTLSATYMVNPFGRTMVLFGPSITWASDDYMHSFFSTTSDRLRPVAPNVSVLPPGSRTGYKADAGFKNAGLSAILIHPLNDDWSLTGIAGYSRLLFDAADSPIVKDNGSRDQFTGGVGLSYTF